MTYDVLIFGAGIAGLSAAAILHKNGIAVKVLEANNRIGGRMQTIRFGRDSSCLVELGANWCHGAAASNSLFTFATEKGVLKPPLVLLDRMEGFCYTSDGKPLSRAFSLDIWKRFQRWEEEMQLWPKGGEGSQTAQLTVRQYFHRRLERELKDFAPVDHADVRAVFNCLMNYYEFHDGGFCDDAPVHMDEYVDIPGGNVKVPEGMGAIVDSLANELDSDVIALNQEVAEIHWDNKASCVTALCTNGQRYHATTAIVTLPLGVLKAGHASMFVPRLPRSKVTAIESIGFGKVAKIFLHFDRPFWQSGQGGIKLAWTDADLAIEDDVIHPSEAGHPHWYKRIFAFDEVLNNPTVLVAWLSGPGAEHMELLSDDVIKDRCAQLMRRFLRNGSIPRADDVAHSRWCSSKFSGGSYSYFACKTQPGQQRVLGAAVRDGQGAVRLLFAGEACSPWAYSTAHGARSSGLDAAHAVLRQLRPSPKL